MAGTERDSTEISADLRAHERTFKGFVHFLMWLFGLAGLAVVFAALTNA